MSKSRRWRVPSPLLLMLALSLLAVWPGHAASPSEVRDGAGAGPPAAPRAVDVVLQPADVGPEFVVASRREQVEGGLSFCAQSLVRTGQWIRLVEPDHTRFIRSFAGVLPDMRGAEAELARAAQELFELSEEVPVAAVGNQSRAAIGWGQEPFAPAFQIVLFRVDRIVGGVIVSSYEAPTTIEEVLRLASIMARRAGG